MIVRGKIFSQVVTGVVQSSPVQQIGGFDRIIFAHPLPTVGVEDTLYVDTTDLTQYFWDGLQYQTIQGGVLELRVENNAIQWRLSTGVWGDLISLNLLKGEKGDTGAQGVQGSPGADGAQGSPGTNGADGTPIELQAINNVLQWRYVGGLAWTTLIDLGQFEPKKGDDDNYVTDAEKLALHSHSNKTALDAVSGTNTGDQDLNGYLLKNTDLQTAETPTDTSLFSWWNGTARVKSTLLALKQYFKGWFAVQNPGICALTPVLPTDIDIDYEAWTLTVARVKGVAISASNPLIFFTDGDGEITKHVKTAPIEFQFTNTSALWHFYFDSTGAPITTVAPWTDFSIIAPVYRLKWQAGTAPTSTLNAISELYECHQNTMTWVDHLHAHLGGTIWVYGYGVTDNRTTGTPNADGRNTVVSLASGTVLDDNLFFTCTNSTSSAMLNQDLGELSAAALNATNSAIFPIRYKGATSAIVAQGTRFPFLFETATNSNRPEYVNSSGVRSLVSNGYYFVYFAYTIQDRRNGQTVRITPAYAQYSTETLAQAVTWETVQAQDPDANDTEIRPLYKMIFLYRSSYNVGCKYTALRSVEDIRKSKITSVSNVGGSINEASVITSARTYLTGTNLATNMAIIDENIIFPHNTISHTTGLLNLTAQSETTIEDVWTSANTGLVITPLKPSANLKSADTILNFSVGASLPTVTWTPDSGITYTWRRTSTIPWAVNKSYTFHFIWISAMRCDVDYKIY